MFSIDFVGEMDCFDGFPLMRQPTYKIVRTLVRYSNKKNIFLIQCTVTKKDAGFFCAFNSEINFYFLLICDA